VRLACSLIAGAIIGYNRGEHGKAAGLRTTLLVCLAAAVAMLQVNALLPLAGRTSDSFVMNDLMRLPLGILTGVGFIGAGAILRRRDVVTGVTTAATLWYVTVIGLCFGGGQILLGWLATAIGCIVLWALAWLERFMVMEFRARLAMTLDDNGPADGDIRRQLHDAALVIKATTLIADGAHRTYVFEVLETRSSSDVKVPAVVDTLGRQPGITSISWRPVG
jgi:putative Mg2+ transporter-C (MgtC) family protein